MTGNHEPIIDPAVWEQVQAELARRAGKGKANAHPFAGKIIPRSSSLLLATLG
uniref:hypothetical protein n=1 Tax=Vaginimicrobium propionicum TaxID=1871034 RepID=UPI0012EB1642|nr:hypothetical protein [Vaginimicrobium propionicum]